MRCGERNAPLLFQAIPQRRIRHPEARPHVLRYQFDGAAIGHWIRLRQIPHSFHQQALALDVTRIGAALPPLASHFWRNRNRENFSHEDRSWRWIVPRVGPWELMLEQYKPPRFVFQPLS